MKYHSFSKHDNRYTLESYGDHLGGPYGRKHPDPSINQHFTGITNTKWNNVTPQYSSTYGSGYGKREQKRIQTSSESRESTRSYARPTVDKSILNRFYPVSAKEHFSRFPKRYELPKDIILAKPSLNTSWWPNSCQPPPTTKGPFPSLTVLGTSQQPYLGKNTWKYSYNSQHIW